MEVVWASHIHLHPHTHTFGRAKRVNRSHNSVSLGLIPFVLPMKVLPLVSFRFPPAPIVSPLFFFGKYVKGGRGPPGVLLSKPLLISLSQVNTNYFPSLIPLISSPRRAGVPTHPSPAVNIDGSLFPPCNLFFVPLERVMRGLSVDGEVVFL